MSSLIYFDRTPQSEGICRKFWYYWIRRGFQKVRKNMRFEMTLFTPSIHTHTKRDKCRLQQTSPNSDDWMNLPEFILGLFHPKRSSHNVRKSTVSPLLVALQKPPVAGVVFLPPGGLTASTGQYPTSRPVNFTST